MDWTKDFRDVVREELGRSRNDKCLKGVSIDEMANVLRGITMKYADQGRKVEYTWKRCHGYRKDGWRWLVEELVETVLRKKGNYVLFGCSTRKHNTQQKILKKVEGVEEIGGKVYMYSKSAGASCRADHAIGLQVANGVTKSGSMVDADITLIDNGLQNGRKRFTVENLSERLQRVTDCIACNLIEVV